MGRLSEVGVTHPVDHLNCSICGSECGSKYPLHRTGGFFVGPGEIVVCKSCLLGGGQGLAVLGFVIWDAIVDEVLDKGSLINEFSPLVKKVLESLEVEILKSILRQVDCCKRQDHVD